MQAWTLTLRDGNRICVPRCFDTLTTYVVLEQEDWFEDEIRFVRRFVRPGMRVVDVGASYGLYTLAAARLAGSGGKVWSFEPADGPRGHLEQSVAENSFRNVDPIDAALSDRDGRGAMSTSGPSELGRLDAGSGSSGEEVRVATLDAVSRERGIERVDLIKLDAEGAEGRILDGGRRVFEDGSPLVLFEIKREVEVDLSLVPRLEAMGYAPFRLVPGPCVLVPFEEAETLDPFRLNLFACRRDRARSLEEAGLLARPSSTAAAPRLDEREAWRGWLERKPFAAAFRPLWEEAQRREPRADRESYHAALSAYALAHDGRRSPAHRVGSLTWCVTHMRALVREADSFPRLCTLARSAAELGERQVCVEALRSLLDLLRRGGIRVDEPFLPVRERFDSIDPSGAVQDWIVVGLLEGLEAAAAHSSYFAGADHAGILEEIRRRRFHGPEAERRRQLQRLRAGLQDRPEPAAVLGDSCEDNRNPGFWCRFAAM